GLPGRPSRRGRRAGFRCGEEGLRRLAAFRAADAVKGHARQAGVGNLPGMALTAREPLPHRNTLRQPPGPPGCRPPEKSPLAETTGRLSSVLLESARIPLL